MEAKARSLTFLWEEDFVKIPFFQRTYVWKINNWDDLLTDLLNTHTNHFLGSLIMKQQKKQTGQPNEVLVIDGQQRLTTLSILLRALYNSLDKSSQKRSADDLNKCLFYKKNPTAKDMTVKIEHSKIDKKYFVRIIRNEIMQEELEKVIVEDPAKKNESKDNNILQCFKFFTDRLTIIPKKQRETLFNNLLNKDNKILVVIDLAENDDEQTIFDTINSAGVRLSSADIIKNALFQRALEFYKPQTEYVEDLYENHWEKVFSSDEDKYWETPRPTGRLMRDNIEILLHCVAVIEGFYDPVKHTLSDLSSCYKDHIAKLGISELEKFIKEIAQYARLFRENIIVPNNKTLFSYNDSHTRLFHVLDVCEITTFHPYILSLFYRLATDVKKLDQELYKVEKLVLRRMITHKDTKNYNKMCKDCIADNSAIDRYILETSDDDIKKGLTFIYNKNASLLLFWVELYRRKNDNKNDITELKFDYSLEHIMPQKWEEHWGSIKVVDENGQEYNDVVAAKAYRNHMIYSIGNMTLLKGSLNTSLRNYVFSRKMEGEGGKKGIRHYADLWITKHDIVEPYDSGDKDWNEQRIAKRTRELAEDILKIW